MNKLAIDEVLRRSLVEDIGFADVTSEAILGEEHVSKGYLIAKEDFVLAGIEVFARTFALIEEKVKVVPNCIDGTFINKGKKFAALEGPTRVLLTGERVALNFLQRMSGIATATRRYIEAAKPFNTVIVDTRKTTPGLRMFEKYAVTAGGGKNHRYGLDSMVMIKDNHIQAAGGISSAVEKVRSYVSPYIKIEVEVETLEQVQEALHANVDVIMLDNMSIALIREAVKLINGRVLVEISGNVTLDRVADLAAAGVDLISVGALTHSVKAADISMKLY